MEPVRMNDPCPCGSKKKYKHCHGKEAHKANQYNRPNNATLLWGILAVILLLGLMSIFFKRAEAPAQASPAPTAQSQTKS